MQGLTYRLIRTFLNARSLPVVLATSILIADRCRTLAFFSFRYTDDDQTLMWYAAREFLAGRIHEPHFYGQSYNTMMEAALAAPLVGLGVPFHIALPLVTVALSCLPFVLFSYWLARAGDYWMPALVLLFPAALPLEYAMLSSMPRGWSPGPFLASVSIFLGMTAQSRRGWFAFGFLAIAAYWASPAALPLILPMGLCAFLRGIGDRRPLAWMVYGMALGALLHFASTTFYLLEPDYELHGPPTVGCRFQALLRGLGGLNRYLGPVSPFRQGWLTLAALAVPSAVFLRLRKGSALVSVALALCVLVFALGTEAVRSAGETIFYHYGRAFLWVPLLIVIVWGLCEVEQRSWLGRPWARAVIPVILLLSAAYKHVCFNEDFQRLVGATTYMVEGVQVALVVQRSRQIESLAGPAGADLVVFEEHQKALAYACEALARGNLKTLLSAYERRTWRYREEQGRQPERFLVCGFSERELRHMRSHAEEVSVSLGVEGLALVRSPRYPVIRFLEASLIP
jgi:hypothetical protein